MSKDQHVCVIRDEINEMEQALERDLPASDVLDFDAAVRILLLKECAPQVIAPLPEFNLEPASLHEKFMSWFRARVELDKSERELHPQEAFEELIRSKRQLERYIGFLRNRARNAVEIAQEVRDNPRLEGIVHDLRDDVMGYANNYAKGAAVVAFVVLDTFQYSRWLKATL